MSNLVQTLLSIKSPYDSFFDKPELIQGYTEDEIKQIEQKYKWKQDFHSISGYTIKETDF